MLYTFAKNLTGFLARIFFRVRFEGVENIPTGGGYIVISNHRTLLDPILIAQKLKIQLHFMAKAELFGNFFTNRLFHALGAFPVQRGRGDSSALDRSREILKAKEVLAMFPEGTRSFDGIPLRPKSGATFIAHETQSDILPCAVHFTGKLRFRTTITVRYGKLLTYEELGFVEDVPSEIRHATTFMMSKVIELLEVKS